MSRAVSVCGRDNIHVLIKTAEILDPSSRRPTLLDWLIRVRACGSSQMPRRWRPRRCLNYDRRAAVECGSAGGAVLINDIGSNIDWRGRRPSIQEPIFIGGHQILNCSR